MTDIVASAPGRVNLIGEHTDYNGGYVFPTALPQQTYITLRPRSDLLVRAVSEDLGPSSAAEYTLGAERQRKDWLDYIQGVTWALAQRGLRSKGVDMTVRSDVPIGKGLSSSASLEVAVLRALRALNGFDLNDVDLAMTAHRAETEFVGAPVGIMDQMVCSLGDARTALFLDAMTRKFEKVAIPDNAVIGVIDSGIEHHHASGDYRIRRRECEDAAAALGVDSLRKLGVDDLARVNALPDPLNRRARHVITENARVLAAVSAMRRNDVQTLGQLFVQSHESMRDDFEVSLPEIDRLVAIALDEPGVYGARLTGGGFGGAIVLLCAKDAAVGATQRVAQRYRDDTRQPGAVLLPQH